MTLDCPTAGFVGSSWRRGQHAQRGSQHCMHCHSMVNARDCTLRPKWQCPLHCHSTSNARAARPHTATRRRAYRNGALRAEWQCRRVGGRGARRGRLRAQGHARARRRVGQGVCRPPGCRERRESDERREAPERAKRVWLKREEGPAGRQREVREGPAPDRSHTGCGPGLPDGRGDANAAQKSMSTLLKNKFHSLSSGHIA